MSAEKISKLRNFIFAFAAFASGLVLPLYAVKVWRKTDYTDFDVYYRSASRMAAGSWDQIYTLADGASPFRYAPVTLPFFRPFAGLTPSWAKIAWFFLQYFWFGLGFVFIYLTIERLVRQSGRKEKLPAFVSSLGLLFILRFCLDCFTIGQVSSLLFLAFCMSFYFWTSWRSGKASTFMLLPALVKIGPGFLYPLFLHGRPKARLRAIFAPLAALSATLALTTVWIRWAAGSWDQNRLLWSKWLEMVRQDSSYYDASHYGSQSVKSALLRFARWDIISAQTASSLYLICALLICGSVLLFWAWRIPRRPMGRALFFSLGVFPYLWVMPETFKYSLTVLAIPVSLLFTDLLQSGRKSRFSAVALAFGVLTLSLAGKDIVGDFLFFGSQKLSLPLLATFFLGAATARLAWTQSRDSALAREFKSLFKSRQVPPWEHEQQPASLEATLLAPLPMTSNVSLDTKAVLDFLRDASARFSELFGKDRYEILVQPYGDRLSESNPLWSTLRELSRQDPHLRLCELKNPARHFPTKNAALRESFVGSRGQFVFTANLEQPCMSDFYAHALSELRSGIQIVRGNRRIHETRFRIPVRLLPIVYRRHRLGLRFNRLVRLILPIQTTDTHSGTLAMPRTFALRVFALQSSMDFLFDLELALIAEAHRVRQKDLPLTLHLAEEKSSRRMAFETLNILLGLPRLARRYRRGCYSPIPLTHRFTADDWGLTPEINHGILDLARRGVVKRVSLMARSSYLTEGLDALRKIEGIELGLHFDLTYLQRPPFRVLLSWMNPLSDKAKRREEVRREFQSQIDKVREAGVDLRYLDGHHHIHLVPGVMDALFDLIQKEGISSVRCPYDPALWLTPKAPLNFLSILARRKLRKYGFASLTCFYPQNGHFFDPGLFRASLARHQDSEVIVHPARSNDLIFLKIQDPYTEGRVLEYRALRMLEHLGSG